jgi:hypothetical protein
VLTLVNYVSDFVVYLRSCYLAMAVSLISYSSCQASCDNIAFMFCHQNIGQNVNIMFTNKSFENVTEFKGVRMTLTDLRISNDLKRKCIRE